MTLSQYTVLSVQGRKAEARVNGVLRGGFVSEGVFYAHAGKARGVVSALIEAVSDLRFH